MIPSSRGINFYSREYFELHMGTFKGSSSTPPPPFSTLLKESEIKGAASLSFTCNVGNTVSDYRQVSETNESIITHS